jgi:hypothetical protein
VEPNDASLFDGDYFSGGRIDWQSTRFGVGRHMKYARFEDPYGNMSSGCCYVGDVGKTQRGLWEWGKSFRMGLSYTRK